MIAMMTTILLKHVLITYFKLVTHSKLHLCNFTFCKSYIYV